MPNLPQTSRQSGLCNFFQTYIKIFLIIAAPLFKLTWKDSSYTGGPLPKEAMDAFCILQNSLTSEPVMAFPRADRQYALIANAATGTADTAGGLGTILTQKDELDNFFAISYTSRQLKDHKRITHLFFWKLLPLSGEWTCITNTSKEKNFILYTDHKPLEKMGHLHTKTINRLQAAFAGTRLHHPIQKR
jgi:RNase H-like domain found in reverse transcriptase